MPRKPRFNAPGISQHVIQRGNNREPCFFTQVDYRHYTAGPVTRLTRKAQRTRSLRRIPCTWRWAIPQKLGRKLIASYFDSI